MVRESLDLLCIMLIVAGEFILVGSGVASGPVNIVFGVLLALVLPGYALSAAVFRMRGVRTAERAALTDYITSPRGPAPGRLTPGGRTESRAALPRDSAERADRFAGR